MLEKNRGPPTDTLQEQVPWKSKYSRGRCWKQKWYLQTYTGKNTVWNCLTACYYRRFSKSIGNLDLSGFFYFSWRCLMRNPSGLSFEQAVRMDFLETPQTVHYDNPFGDHTEHNIVYSYIRDSLFSSFHALTPLYLPFIDTHCSMTIPFLFFPCPPIF